MTKSSEPLRLTVIIPSHRDDLVTEAFASAMGQTVIDRVQVLVSFVKSRVYDAAWPERVNALLPSVLGDYLVLLGDDDKLTPTFAERVLAVATTTHADVISTTVQQDGGGEGIFHGERWELASFRRCAPVWFTTAIRASLFRELGGLDASLLYQDLDLWYRAYKAGAKHVHIDEVLWFWRFHGASQGSASIRHADAMAQIYAKHPELAP